VEIIAHRGSPRHEPENSIPGFVLAARAGVAGLELDVHRTRDGVVVVHHDPVMPDGTPIDTLTSGELRRYELAPGVEIPTLAAVLDAVRQRAPVVPVVYVEIKGRDIEASVIDVVDHSPVPCAVHAFDHRVARRVTAMRPALPTGVLLDSYLVDPAGALRAAGARDYWQSWRFIDAALVERVHDAGGRVIAWTVNTREDAEALRDLGVDAICSDIAATLAH
jgi:glycerophosphoryl diester phosphodiesterase